MGESVHFEDKKDKGEKVLASLLSVVLLYIYILATAASTSSINKLRCRIGICQLLWEYFSLCHTTLSYLLRAAMPLKTPHNSPSYDEYQTHSANVFALQRECAYRKEINDSPTTSIWVLSWLSFTYCGLG